MHSIVDIRRLIDEVNLAPFSSENKAFIIDDAERMLPTSSNALLKTLEEPPKNTLIILVTSSPEKLLPTIISRCQQVRFCPVEQSVGHNLEEANEIIVHLSKKRAFFEIAHFAKDFQKRLDAKKKAFEQELKAQFAASLKDATPQLKQMIEQEMDGAISVLTMQHVNELFFVIQAFFLDIERLQANMPLTFESHRQLITEERKMPPERIAKSIQSAKTSIERSSPIQNTLETLLLEVNGS
jgi:DNA polymerase III delta prime subunit